MKSLLIIICTIWACTSYGQRAVDAENDKSTSQDCYDQYAGLEIFKVVMTPPLITSHDYDALISSVEQTVRKMRLNKKQKTIITLKVIFPTEGKPCMYSLELNGDHLRDEKVQEIIFELTNINEYECGTQAKRKVICESIFDIIIKKGKLHDIQYDNVRFR